MTVNFPLNIRLFGAPQVYLGETPVEGFISNKVRALFYYLVMTRQPHTRDTLAGLLWGEMPNSEARANLRKALSNLRKLFPEAFRIDRQTVAFETAHPHSLDVAEFSALMSRREEAASPKEEAALLRQAAALYRGEFLAGFYLTGTPAFSEWVLGWREHLGEQALQALYTLAELHLNARQYAQAVPYLKRVLAIDPWREETHRQLMLAYARQGQENAALAQYRACEKILSTELDVLPAPETRLLYERIRARKRAPADNLPRQSTPFIGRRAEMQAVLSALTSADCRLLTITGIGGVGKTRLALEAASRLKEHFFDGVFFLSTASLHTRQALLGAIGAAIDMPFAEQGGLLEQLIRRLRHHEMLLVLDNFEHLTDLAPLLGTLLENTAGLTLLVTSRKRLHIPWEHVFVLEGLCTEADSRPGGREEFPPAVQVFLHNARRVRHDFRLSPQDSRTVLEICRHVGGVPLAIELAALWVSSLTCRQILGKIRRGSDFLDAGRGSQPARERNIQAVLEYAWRQLAPAEQKAFTRLAAFSDAFTARAAAEVAGASTRMLARFLEHGVITRVMPEAAQDAWYNMHPLWRQFAARQLARQPAEEQAARRAHQRYYARLLEEYASAPARGRPGAFPREADFNNILRAWEHALEQEERAGFERYTGHLAALLEARNRYDELRTILLQAVERARSQGAEAPVLAHWLRLIGEACFRAGQLPESLEYHRQALALLDRPLPETASGQMPALGRELLRQVRRRLLPGGSPYPRGAPEALPRLESARIYERLGQILFFQNAPSAILLYISIRGLNLAEEVAPTGTLARLYGNMILGGALVAAHPIARFYRRLALKTANALASPAALSWVLELSSIYLCGIWRWQEAERDAAQAMELAERLGDTRRRDECRVMPAHIAHQRGDFRGSAQIWADMYISAYQRGDAQAQRWALSGQAENFLPLGRVSEAISYIKTALDMPLQIADTSTDISCYGLLALAYLQQGRYREAESAARIGLRLVSETSPTAFSSLDGYAALAHVYLRLWSKSPADTGLADSAAKAEATLWQFSRIFPIGRPQALLYRGVLAWQSGRARRALRLWRKGAALARRMGMPYHEAVLCTHLQRCLPPEDPQKAAAAARAASIYERLRVPPA